MSSQNADIQGQSDTELPGSDSPTEVSSITNDHGTAQALEIPRDESDAKTGFDEPACSEEVTERFIDIRDLFEQGNSIVATIPGGGSDSRYGDKTRVAIFEGVKDGKTVYFKIAHASTVGP